MDHRRHLSLALISLILIPLVFGVTHDQKWNRNRLVNLFGKGDNLKSKPPGMGFSCVTCTIILNTIEQYSETHQVGVDNAIKDLCSFLPEPLGTYCDEMGLLFGNAILLLIGENDLDADEACAKIGFCSNECHLFPNEQTEKKRKFLEKSAVNMDKVEALLKETPWDWFMARLEQVMKNHLPFEDIDGDRYSTIEGLRGASWRGRDCDDGNANIYAGRRTPSDPSRDYNCNGIYGRDQSSGKTWEELLCGNTTQLGVAIAGGSACSHFEIPVKWFDYANLSPETFKDAPLLFENELDRPDRSWSTGFDSTSITTSLYQQIRSRNLCNHRDYQNTAVNGASMRDVGANLIQDLHRDVNNDAPLLLVINPLGDDICNMNADDTIDRMTTVPEFREAIFSTLNYLNNDTTGLPMGSHILFMGIVDGRVLWDNLHNKPHPLRSDLTYEMLYSWLLCERANPCIGWLNPNETLRNYSSERAKELSDQYRQIVSQYKYKRFDMAYYDFPLQELIDAWTSQGRSVIDLIEPVDGFHPSQQLHNLLGNWVYKKLSQDHPNFLGDVNVNNAKIVKIFGDQGGY